jgi:hypothetical protein
MNYVTTISGKPKITWQQTSANTAAGLTAANIVSASGYKAIGALITCETNNVRYSLDGSNDPDTDGFGHLLLANAGLVLDNPKQIENFTFVSATADSAGILTITSLFGRL